MKLTFSLLSLMLCLPILAQDAVDPKETATQELKRLIDQGITSGPEFEKALSASRGESPAKEAPMSFEKLETTEGKIYEDVKVRKVDPDGLSIIHAAGAKKILFSELSGELQRAYGYDEEKAADFIQKQREAEAAGAMAMRQQEAERRLRMADSSLKTAVTESAVNYWVKIMQNPGEGEPCICYWSRVIQRPVYDRSGLRPKVTGYTPMIGEEEESFIAVHGLSRLADDSTWTGSLYPAGNYTYQSVGGGRKTVKQYATTAAQATELLKK